MTLGKEKFSYIFEKHEVKFTLQYLSDVNGFINPGDIPRFKYQKIKIDKKYRNRYRYR